MYNKLHIHIKENIINKLSSLNEKWRSQFKHFSDEPGISEPVFQFLLSTRWSKFQKNWMVGTKYCVFWRRQIRRQTQLWIIQIIHTFFQLSIMMANMRKFVLVEKTANCPKTNKILTALGMLWFLEDFRTILFKD